MQDFLEAISGGATSEELASIAVPESYRAAFVRHQDVEFGVALYLPDEHGESGRIKSLFPKAWSVR